MARNTTILVPARTWVQLTNADATNVTFQAQDDHVFVKGTAGAVAPTDTLGSMTYPPYSGEANVTLTDLFPGVAGVNRLWVFCVGETAVAVSHA